MYLPYIRAKQFDLAAITELRDPVYKQKRIIPIIEPVTDANKGKFKRLSEKQIPFILVVNPIVGKFKSLTPHADILTNLVNDLFDDNKNCVLGFIIQPKTTLAQVKSFITVYPDHDHAFIHFHQFADPIELAKLVATDKKNRFNIFIDGHISTEYVEGFSKNNSSNVLIKDGFIKQVKNELYPDEDFFSNLHKTYKTKLGYDGFGDFTIIGSKYETSGGPAFVVALHLTNKDATRNLVVRHFKSDAKVPPSSVDPGGKFKQALARLKKYIDATGLKTDGIDEYLELHKSGHYPGLGIPKKISIKHHIEVVFSLM